ncbi:MAG TPA: RecQ family ATP-dependent DNA helicase [Lentimicrobium sp.]|nr:RecQ family ATP-dependent DNA helicase [Lentimicrobium sp.]
MEIAKEHLDITFIDLEVSPSTKKIADFGALRLKANQPDLQFHNASASNFLGFISNTEFICGHNIFSHDLKYLHNYFVEKGLGYKFIDTLLLSPLLFPAKPYHHMVKDDKLQTEELNNPLNDSIKAKDLFFDEVDAFKKLRSPLKIIYYRLLGKNDKYCGFFEFMVSEDDEFRYINQSPANTEVLIKEFFSDDICNNCNLDRIIESNPVELAYALALVSTHSRYSITPPWVLKQFPHVENVLHLLRNNPCITGCSYCDELLDIHEGLRKFFGFNSFRSYDGEPLQENAVRAAVNGKSLLAIFPTGGGKSLTFQVPALMAGESVKGLTVVISPLQSLMKDQVDNLEKAGITEAVTINGLLDSIERAKSIERVSDGSASMLYIAPESLRSKTIESILLGRKIVRFVIDEAHCFSSWGQDFRVDYLYIAEFIESIQKQKQLDERIPVSCFTATAKPKVIEDIRAYFRDKLHLELELYTSKASRKNLIYRVYNRGNDEEKYNAVRNLLEEKDCPTIIYVSRTRKADELAAKLVKDGYPARAFHGKMDSQVKTENQNAFIAGEVSVMVATSAFGMGVDKKDVGRVIHYDISDSLENYVQEAGRAGRDENITADCCVLFNENDLDKHFILLNQTKLNIKEIQQVWKAVKDLTRFRAMVSNSALEIARQAGWDDSITDIETRVTTAIAALEDAGYLRRGQNSPRIFASSIITKTAQEAIDKINASGRFNEKDKDAATRIIKKLVSAKRRQESSDETAESRVDYIADHLGIVKNDIIRLINLMKEEKILSDAKDLSAFIRRNENKNHSIKVAETYAKLENLLLPKIEQEEKTLHLKEINQEALDKGLDDVTPNKIKTILNFWAIKNWIKRETSDYQNNRICVIGLLSEEKAREKQERRQELSRFIIEFLFDRSFEDIESLDKDEILVQFSVMELKEAYNNRNQLFTSAVEAEDVEDALFYLSRINALKIDGGFLVVYNKLTIERLEDNRKIQYKNEDYRKLEKFYENKRQQIHIVGEYAKKMVSDYKEALQFVDDYFQLNYQSFLDKYFKGTRQEEITRNITPAKFKKLFGDLSPTQLNIVNNQTDNYIVVAAGPGSGKTKLLVHKLASLVLMEDVKYEQLLMLTFSRAAATEFKKRLIDLIGNAALNIQIMTFHSYCFNLLGKIGSIDKSESIIKDAVQKIKNKDIEPNLITKTVLVIDEAQDMSEDEYALVKVLMDYNDGMRVIAVGDDDQNIYEFRNSSSKHLYDLIETYKAKKFPLLTNFRSKKNLVEFTNEFARCIRYRLKNEPVQSHAQEYGSITLICRKIDGSPVMPFVANLLNTELRGSACILTKTNDEALEITGLLIRNRIPARLIQSNDGFSVFNLNEVRYFLNQLNFEDSSRLILDETWKEAHRRLKVQFKTGADVEICNKIIRNFEACNPKKKYKSDFEEYIKESKLEDFIASEGEIILVSTMHKAKGREFDNIFIMLHDHRLNTEEDKRLLYVAMTRARENLLIHYSATNNSVSLHNILNRISVPGLQKLADESPAETAKEMVMQLSHKEVYLGYFTSRQSNINKLQSGDILQYKNYGCTDTHGNSVLKFSKQFVERIDKQEKAGYKITKCLVNHIVYWKNDETGTEIKIVLPEISFTI